MITTRYFFSVYFSKSNDDFYSNFGNYSCSNFQKKISKIRCVEFRTRRSIILWSIRNRLQDFTRPRDRNQTKTIYYLFMNHPTYRKTLQRLIISFKPYGAYRSHGYRNYSLISRSSTICDSLCFTYGMEQNA